MKKSPTQYTQITDMIVSAGLRPTRQRVLLGHILFSKGHRHVTAEILHREAREANVHVSLATVYNTLHQFTRAKLLRELSVEDGLSYFDTNTHTHHHFLCEETGALTDIPEHDIALTQLPPPPAGRHISGVDVVIRLRGTH